MLHHNVTATQDEKVRHLSGIATQSAHIVTQQT